MKQERVKVVAKIGGRIIGSKVVPYDFPPNLDEAIASEGKADVYKVYSVKRKTNFMDKIRRKMVDEFITKLTENEELMAELEVDND